MNEIDLDWLDGWTVKEIEGIIKGGKLCLRH